MLILSHVCYFNFLSVRYEQQFDCLIKMNVLGGCFFHKEAQRGFCLLLNFEFMHYGGSVYLDSFTEFFQLHNSTEMIKHMVKLFFMVVRGEMDLNMVQYGSLNKSNYLYVR